MEFNEKKIESILDYTFTDKSLLEQAFTRSSYAEEYGGEDNEVLEFIGDKALDLAVVRLLTDAFGDYDEDGYFVTSKDEGQLTEMKAALVNSDSLAEAIERLGLDKYLILGDSDQKVTKSMKEDLFEAIIGAIALDCDWDFDTILEEVDFLLHSSDFINNVINNKNFVGELQERLTKEGCGHAIYTYWQKNTSKGIMWMCHGQVDHYKVEVDALGNSKKEARQSAAKILLENIYGLDDVYEEETAYGIIGEPDRENALQQLNQLVQHNYISKPTYKFECNYDSDGNPIWTCKCRVNEIKEYYFVNHDNCSNSKKAAQKDAVYSLLDYLVSEEDDCDDEYDD